LDLPRLTVGRVTYEETDLSLDVGVPHQTSRGERSTAKLQLTLKGGSGGFLSTSASQDLSWKNGLVPELDLGSPTAVDLETKRFRLAIAAPFLEGVVSRLDGFLDGTSHLLVQPGSGARIGDVKLALTDGSLHLPQLGQELHGITLEVARDGAGQLV